jgi:fatty-acyl-CoA synthase
MSDSPAVGGAGALLCEPLAGRGWPRARLRVFRDGRFEELSATQWLHAAERAAGSLRASGVERGSRVACILSNCPSACVAVFGVWFAGGTLLSLPTISRGMAPELYGDLLRRLCAQGEAELLLVEERFAGMARELVGAREGLRVVSFEALERGPRLAAEERAEEEIVFVQYSSGSTREPRGCMLSAGAIARHTRMLGDVLEIDPTRDRAVLWIPLSHDMGLFGGLLSAWALGLPFLIGTPERFLRSPATWVRDCADFQASLTTGPSFGLALAARAVAATGGGRQVRRVRPLPMRRWIVGGERVSFAVLRQAHDVLAPLGVPFGAFSPAYGLAEATLAVTMPREGEEPHALAACGEVVACGRPLDGIELAIDETGADGWAQGAWDVEEPVGEVLVRSPALAAGYLGNPRLTRERFGDPPGRGPLRTGDVGFLRDGELHVLGRADDMIAVGGRNIHAGDFEQQVGPEIGVRNGSAVLVDVPDGPATRLVVLAEPLAGREDHARVAQHLREHARRTLGVQVDECLLLAPRTIPKTPSGKIQRFRCRALVESGAPEVLASAGG